MSNPNDDGYAQAVVETVRDMQRKLDENKRAGDEGRAHLLHNVEGLIASLRQDVHKTIASLQLAISDDRAERAKRQQQVDAQLAEVRKLTIWNLVGLATLAGLCVGGVAVYWLTR